MRQRGGEYERERGWRVSMRLSMREGGELI